MRRLRTTFKSVFVFQSFLILALMAEDRAMGQCESQILTASDAAALDWFSRSVDISGDIAIVGAYENDEAGKDSGSAYIFERNQGGSDNWGEVKKLTASDAAVHDWFGYSVSISGDIAIVGSILNDDAGNSSGSAYIFARHQGGTDNWGEVKKLTASDAAAGDDFGYSVAISGDIAIVGSLGNDDAGYSSGSVYIFARHQGGKNNWGEVKKLTASDAAAGDDFGYSVAISGDIAIVGSLGNDDAGYSSGSVYIFARHQGGTDNWGEVKKLTASDAEARDQFGHSVAISSEIAIVGANRNDDVCPMDPGCESGSAYVFARNQGGADNWGEVKKLTASDAAEDDQFGRSVAVNGDTAIVGAWGNDDAGNASGSAYVFARHQGGKNNWGEVRKLTASDAAAYDQFGDDVAINGDTAIVGAFGNGDAGIHSGSAYIFSTSDADCNANGICDTIDLQAGTSCDRNDNLILDECEPYCIADFNCDGTVNRRDLLTLIRVWEGQDNQDVDLSADDRVNVDDLLLLIGAWGPCP